MSTFPESPRADFLQWCQAHAPIFTANAAAIGLTTGQASAFSTATTATAAALLAQNTAHDAARDATETCQDAFASLRTAAGDTVRLIRAFAEVQTKPLTVYTTASIPPPAAPSPAAPPAQPINLSVSLDATNGELTLRWKATNPAGTSGTSYIIRRKAAGQSEFVFVGTSTGRKVFVDTTLTAGPDSVQYTVQGQRSDVSGPISPICTVYFGRTPSGQLTAHVGQSNEHAAGSSAADVNGSTVNGKAVQKTLPTGNGHASRV